ncbi:MAG TPA: hypothetical protein VM915_05870 [Verrucomicrobiae bacterium]|nr:hypothetical protein [Verrucomicrobiae bacterium]
MKQTATILLITAALALGACSHGGSRHFGGTGAPPGQGGGGGGGSSSPPPWPLSTTGTLERTTDTAGDLVGGVLHVGGNVVLGIAENTNLPLVGGVGEHLNNLGDTLQDGVGGLPVVGGTLDNTIQTLDGTLNPIAAVEVAGIPALGASPQPSNQLIGASLLSENPRSGSLATVALLPQEGGAVPVTVALGDTTLIGGGANGGPLGGVTGIVGGLTGGLPSGDLGGGEGNLSLEGALGGVLEIAPTAPGSAPGGIVGGVLSIGGGVEP